MSLRMIFPSVSGVAVGGSLDAVLAAGWGTPQITSDVTEWLTLAAPQDDIHGALLAELQHAATAYPAGSVECHSSQYGFTDADIAAAFEPLAANPASRFLFDKSQAAGHYEAPLIAQFKAKVRPAQIAIGTSSVDGQILHTKATCLLYPDGTGWTLTGSWNVSKSAQEQFNVDDLVRSRSRAELFASKIDAMFEWVSTHEPQGDSP